MIGFLVSSVFLRLGFVASSSTAATVDKHRVLKDMECCGVTSVLGRVDCRTALLLEANLLLLPPTFATLSRVRAIRKALPDVFIMFVVF